LTAGVDAQSPVFVSLINIAQLQLARSDDDPDVQFRDSM